MSITEFLLARIEEDEYEANVCLDQYARGDGGSTRRWVRQLAECKAFRRIVEMHPVYDCDDQHDCPGEWPNYAGPGDPCPTLLAIASVYADHADYRDEWQV